MYEEKLLRQQQYTRTNHRKIKEGHIFKKKIQNEVFEGQYESWAKKQNSSNASIEDNDNLEQDLLKQFTNTRSVDAFIRKQKFATKNNDGLLYRGTWISPVNMRAKKFNIGNAKIASAWDFPTYLLPTYLARRKENQNGAQKEIQNFQKSGK